MERNLNNIDAKIHKYLYPYSIKRFLESEFGSLLPYIEMYEIKSDDYIFSKLLDSMIYHKELSDFKVDKFLIDELNYGRLRNVFVSFIRSTRHLEIEENIIENIKKLVNKGYLNAEKVNKSSFVYNIRKGMEKGKKELVWFCIDKDEEEIPINVRFLLAEGINNFNKGELNNYIGVEINLKYNLLVIKLRNWGDNSGITYNLDELHRKVQDEIKKTFNLIIPHLSATAQNLVYNMVNDLSYNVLNQTINKVNEKLKPVVRPSLNKWSEKLLNDGGLLPEAEFEILEENILNNYYRISMQSEYGNLKVGDLKDKFGVKGYPRYVSFKDDTIGEGRAKSPDPKESLLDTSIYYDIKARLDQAQLIRLATIYWIDSPYNQHFGTTFYTDVQERFKFVVLPNFFNKEMNDYVLRQIDRYRQK